MKALLARLSERRGVFRSLLAICVSIAYDSRLPVSWLEDRFMTTRSGSTAMLTGRVPASGLDTQIAARICRGAACHGDVLQP